MEETTPFLTPEDKKQILDEFQARDLNISAWCRRREYSVSGFYALLNGVRGRSMTRASKSIELVKELMAEGLLKREIVFEQ